MYWDSLIFIIGLLVNDIEDIVSTYEIAGIDESIGFSCTMCGECCRTSDHIFLTPLDMFVMSRSRIKYILLVEISCNILL